MSAFGIRGRSCEGLRLSRTEEYEVGDRVLEAIENENCDGLFLARCWIQLRCERAGHERASFVEAAR